MSQQHSHKGLEEHQHGPHCSHGRKQLHRDWRMWVIVSLMLGAMVIYLLTLDERLVPAPVENPPPASAPAQP